MTVELRSARSLSLAERVVLFNAAYEDYVIPFRLDEGALEGMIDWFDLDVEASRVALRDGEPIGFGNLGLRGDQAWIGGVGVVTSARRQGIGELLMRALHDEAAARHVSKVWLEVIEQNDAAYRLYEKLGYDLVRWVEVWTLPTELPGPSLEVPVEQAHARIRELRTGREPWQRSDATLDHYDDARGVATDDGAAIFRVAGAAQVVQIAGEPRELLRAVRSNGNVVMLNLPAGDPVGDAMRELGGSITVRQREMVLDLTGRG
ncbi:MAG TPA: GNAT family N-acetyltransferase [Gaiellaceae bacterium]